MLRLKTILIFPIVSFSVFGFLFSFSVQEVRAATRYEYYTTGDDSSGTTCGSLWYSQTFTPATSYKITSVKLKLIGIGYPGTFLVSIRATDGSFPTNVECSMGQIDGNGLTHTWPGAWYEIPQDCPVYASTKYAIVVAAPSGTGLDNMVQWMADCSSPTYAGGNSGTSYDSGLTWSASTNCDFMFEVWGEPLPIVTTDTATVNLSTNQATLNGTLVSRGGASSCYVTFHYNKPGETGYPNYTGWQIISADNASFNATLSSPDFVPQTVAGNTYQWRAWADCISFGGGANQGVDKQVVIYQSSGGQLSFTTPSGCTGSVLLSLSPNPANPSATITGAASGLSGCDGKTVYIKQTSCSGTQKCTCSVSGSGCSCTFTGPSSAGTYTYYACVDKNADGDYADSGESDSETLTVQSDCTRANPEVTLSPESQDGNPQVQKCYSVRVYNNDATICGDSTFTLSKSCPLNWTCVLEDTSLTLSPGWTYTSLCVTPPAGATVGSYQVSVTALNQTAYNAGEGTYSGSDSATYNITGCTGSIDLTLIPPTVAPSGSVTPSASGLSTSGCVGKTISFKQDSCSGSTVSSCTISTGADGCTGSSFTAPDTPATYTYYACIDKNGDEDYLDTGEQDSAILNVTVASCIEGGVCANPGDVCCTNGKLYTCQQNDTTTVFYSTVSDGFLECYSSLSYTAAHHLYSASAIYDLYPDYFYQKIQVGQYCGSSSWTVMRGALFFNTSSLPDDANITAAKISIYPWSINSAVNTHIVSGAELDEPLVSSDYYPDLYNADVSRGSIAWSSVILGAYNNIYLNSIGISEINKTGTTKFGVRSKDDIDFYEAWGEKYIHFDSSEGTNKPKLSVTYTGTPTWQYTQDCSYGCCDTSNNSCDPCLPPTICQCCSDTTPPTVSVAGAPASWQKTDATANISCTDAGSGCDTATYRLKTYTSNPGTCSTNYADYTLTSPQTISSYLWLCGTAKDIAGNTGFSTPVEFKVDKIKPVSEITAPEAGSTQTADFNVAVSDADTGGSGMNPGACYYRTYDSTAGWTRDWTLRTCNATQLITVGAGKDCQTEGGTCTVYVYSYDNAGNQSDTDSRSFNILATDTDAPTTTIKIIRTATAEDVTTAGAWLRADTYTIRFEDKDQAEGSGLNCENCTTEYSVYACDVGGTNCNTLVISLTSRTPNFSFDIVAGKTAPTYNLEGAARYRIYSGAKDMANNSASEYRYINFDFTPPETHIE